jgi:hypothetical protein
MGKHKSFGSIKNSHLSADRKAAHIDLTRSHLNRVLLGSNIVDDVAHRLEGSKAARKADSVLVNEILIAASPGHLKNDPNDPTTMAFFNDSLAFLQKKYGRENVVYAVVQFDEGNPHMHAAVVPVHQRTIKTGRGGRYSKEMTSLDSKHFFGTPGKLRTLQTEFASAVKGYGLQRGIEGSEAKHQDIKKFYAVANKVNKTNEKISNDFQTLDPTEVLKGLRPQNGENLTWDGIEKAAKFIEHQAKTLTDLPDTIKAYFAQSGLQALGVAAHKVGTKDKFQLKLTEKHLRDKHDEKLDWSNGGVINLKHEREQRLLASIQKLDSARSWKDVQDRLDKRDIVTEIDHENSVVTFKIDGKPVESPLTYDDFEEKMRAQTKKLLFSDLGKPISKLITSEVTPARLVEHCNKVGIAVLFYDDNGKEVSLPMITPSTNLFFGYTSDKGREAPAILEVDFKSGQSNHTEESHLRSLKTWGDIENIRRQELDLWKTINKTPHPTDEEGKHRRKHSPD